MKSITGKFRGVMAKALDCNLEISEFKLRSRYYIQFRTNTLEKGTPPPTNPPDYVLNSILFYKDGFGIKYPTKVDMPLNKEVKLNQSTNVYP